MAKEDLIIRFGAGLLAVLVLCGSLALAGCNGGGAASDPPPASPSSQSIEIAPPASGSSTIACPNSAPVAMGGRVLALGDEKLSTFPQMVLGTEEALAHWEALAKSGEAVFFEVCDRNDSEGELSAEDAAAIAGILANAELRLYDSLGNPATGGSTHIIGYDAEGAMLFHAIYDDYWFSVYFPEEEVGYVFDGEQTLLDTLRDHIPNS